MSTHRERRGLVERLRIREPLLGRMCDEAADRIEALEAALRFLLDTKWKSVGKDNMEFEGRVTCYQLDKARAALAPEIQMRNLALMFLTIATPAPGGAADPG